MVSVSDTWVIPGYICKLTFKAEARFIPLLHQKLGILYLFFISLNSYDPVFDVWIWFFDLYISAGALSKKWSIIEWENFSRYHIPLNNSLSNGSLQRGYAFLKCPNLTDKSVNHLRVRSLGRFRIVNKWLKVLNTRQNRQESFATYHLDWINDWPVSHQTKPIQIENKFTKSRK